jgi:hypothetical protein
MKTILRRLRRLEEHRLGPPQAEKGESLADLLWERRRRRLEASGEPMEVRPCGSLTDDHNRPLSVAEILRRGRRRVAASNQRSPG